MSRGSWLSRSVPPALLELAGAVPSFRETVAHLHEDAGRVRRAAQLLSRSASPYANRMRGLAAAIDQRQLAGIEAPDARPGRIPFNRRALMVLYASPPWLDNGYTVRTRCLLDELAQQGMDCTDATRPNFPNDIAAFRDAKAVS